MPIPEQTKEQREAAFAAAGQRPVVEPQPIDKTQALLQRGNELGAAASKITGVPFAPSPIVGTSAPVRQELTARGVTDQDAFNVPTQKTFEEIRHCDKALLPLLHLKSSRQGSY